MRPIFTVHAGEYVVANKIESIFRNLKVWVPSKDDGIDLLVTDLDCQKIASLQVKFSKNHLVTAKKTNADSSIVSGGWWSFNLEKMQKSSADYWVLVLSVNLERSYNFIVIRPSDLISRIKKIHNVSEIKSTIQSYFWVTDKGKCFETRGLSKEQEIKICTQDFIDEDRDFTIFLNKWPFKNIAIL